jgi:hypothetical protein
VPGAIQNGYGTEVQQPFGTVLRVPEQPVIKVSIGRINIRAEVQKVAPVMMRKQVTSQPRMSLEDYLKKQNNPAK